jgi:hypothetical protein
MIYAQNEVKTVGQFIDRRRAGPAQPMTKFSPTAVSSVELAACKEADQVWSPTIPSTATPAQP